MFVLIVTLNIKLNFQKNNNFIILFIIVLLQHHAMLEWYKKKLKKYSNCSNAFDNFIKNLSQKILLRELQTYIIFYIALWGISTGYIRFLNICIASNIAK